MGPFFDCMTFYFLLCEIWIFLGVHSLTTTMGDRDDVPPKTGENVLTGKYSPVC